jgi:hypothetical protein
LSQRSVRIKNKLQNMKGTSEDSIEASRKGIMIHKQNMEIKTENGANVTTEAG